MARCGRPHPLERRTAHLAAGEAVRRVRPQPRHPSHRRGRASADPRGSYVGHRPGRAGFRRRSFRRRFVTPFAFIVGCPRSGTTLLRAMVDSHPDIAIPASRISSSNSTRSSAHGGGDASRLMRSSTSCSRTSGSSNGSYRSATCATPCAHRAHAATTPTRCASSTSATPRTSASPRYGDKTPNYVLDIPLLGARLSPEARFVHFDSRLGAHVASSVTKIPEWIRGGTDRRGDIGSNTWKRAATWRGVGRRSLHGTALRRTRHRAGRCVAACEHIFRSNTTTRCLQYTERFDEVIAPDLMPQYHQRLRRPPTPGLRSWRDEMPADDVAASNRSPRRC